MFKITTDITCDLSDEQLKELNIDALIMSYQIDDILYPGNYKNRQDLLEFYSILKSGKVATTSQPSPYEFEMFFKKYIDNGEKDILHFALSNGLTSTNIKKIENDINEKYKSNVKILDTLCASAGLQVLIDIAIKLRDEGKSVDETYDYLFSIRTKIHHFFVVGDLKYLKRSGRISGTKALIGKIFNITPILILNKEGKIVPFMKTVGIKKALNEMIQYTQKYLTGDNIYLAEGDALKNYNFIKDNLLKKFPDKTIKLSCIGKIIGSHVGSDTITVIFLSDKERLL